MLLLLVVAELEKGDLFFFLGGLFTEITVELKLGLKLD